MMSSFNRRLRFAIAILIVLHAVCLLSQTTGESGFLVINEVVSVNVGGLADEDGDYPDWVEIYNRSGDPVQLENFGLSDDIGDPLKWTFPRRTLNGGERLLVFLSGKDRTQQAQARTSMETFTSPAQIPGLILWLDGSDSESLVREGDRVVQWKDKSGGARHAVQPDLEKRPRVERDAASGLDVIWFDGDGELLQFPRLDNIMTFILVLKEAEDAPNRLAPLLGDTTSYDLHRGNDSLLYSRFWAGAILGGSSWLNGRPIRAELERLPSDWSLIAGMPSRPISANVMSSDRLLDNRTWHGPYAEVLLFDRALNASERMSMENYLTGKWNLPRDYLHANFSLDDGEEPLALSDAQGRPLDLAPPGKAVRSGSKGRLPDGGDRWVFFQEPTPFLENGGNHTLEPPREISASPLGGLYSGPVEITLDSPGSNGPIHFTLDGSEPAPSSPLYQAPIRLEESAVLKARQFTESDWGGETLVQSYILDFQSEFPVVSISVDPEGFFDETAGIYATGPDAEAALPHYGANYWKDLEKPSVLQFFEPGGEGSFTAPGGIRIHGGFSRSLPQKSLKFFFREKYGMRWLEYPVFGEALDYGFKRLVLRNSGNDWIGAMMRDAFIQRLISTMELDTQASRAAHAFINGEYWGIYNLREKHDAFYLASIWGVDSEDIDQIEGDGAIMSGDHLLFDDFKNYLIHADLASEQAIETLSSKMDIDNYMDYMIAEIFIHNDDWPNNNVRLGRVRQAGGRFRWLPFDLDGGFNRSPEFNALERVLTGAAADEFHAIVLQRLLTSEDLKRKFINRFQYHLNVTFDAARVLEALERMEESYLPEIQKHIDRWGGSPGLGGASFASIEEWRSNLQVLKTFAIVRPLAMREHLREQFALPESVEVRIEIENPERGGALVEGLPVPVPDSNLPETWSGVFFRDHPIHVAAAPAPGYRFVEWRNLSETSPQITVLPGDISGLRPRFEPIHDSAIGGMASGAFALSEGPYTFHGFAADSPEGGSPPFIRLYQTGVKDPGLEVETDAPWTHRFDLESRSRILGREEMGLSFLNTSQPQSEGGTGGYVGSAVLDVNTLGATGVQLGWTGRTMKAGPRPYAIRVQYRIGSDDPFTDLLDANARPIEYRSERRDGAFELLGPYPLPSELENQPLVQLRWKYYSPPTAESGERPELAIDNIAVFTSGQTPEFNQGDVVLTEIMYHAPNGRSADEWLEIYNRGYHAVQLDDWEFDDGVEFAFPSILLHAGERLVVAADIHEFRRNHPDVGNAAGGWTGGLANSGERIRLKDADGRVVDEVQYSDQGDWAERRFGAFHYGHRGLVWHAGHDGLGKSLELRNLGLPNDSGQNWGESAGDLGTPGRANSIEVFESAPMISNVRHFPIVPSSSDAVRVRARVYPTGDEDLTLFYRLADGAPFEAVSMVRIEIAPDDFGVYQAQIPPQPNDAIVEFYLEARSASGWVRAWPAPIQPEGAQSANLLYQVDDANRSGDLPARKLILTRRDLENFKQVQKTLSDASFNGTFISQEDGRVELRYLVSIKNRGATTRTVAPYNRRVNFRHDDTWRGKRAINLNMLNTHSQVAGSGFFQLAGLPSTLARPVRLIENNERIGGDGFPRFGAYAQVEVLNGDFTERQFPDDDNGNLYQNAWRAELGYWGEDAAAYNHPEAYGKRTNESENDWSDIIDLTRSLDASGDGTFVAEALRVADIDQWLRHLATHAFLGNQETSLPSGDRGDYALYSGEIDRRFRLIPHDLDSLFGLYGGLDDDVFQTTFNPVLSRILHEPVFGRLFVKHARELAETLFHPDRAPRILNQMLGLFVDSSTLNDMSAFLQERRGRILDQLTQPLTVAVALPVESFYYKAEGPSASMEGTFNALETQRVEVNGREARLSYPTSTWSLDDLEAGPGITRVVVEAFDASGALIERTATNIWRDTNEGVVYQGTLERTTVMTRAESPHWIEGDLLVPAGVTLILEAGATLFLQTGASVTVEGSLQAIGEPDNRVRLTRYPNTHQTWRGLRFVNSKGDNRLSYVDFEYATNGSLLLTDSVLRIDHADWQRTSYNSTRTENYLIRAENSSLEVRNSRFPDLEWYEHINGVGMPEDGFFIIENNRFGTTLGYNDIIDFSGGKRPGPVVQILNNVFTGGSDEMLDLDGADAHIEGNVFMNGQKNNASDSIAAAISTGEYLGENSELTVVRNVFLNNDHDILLKEDAFVHAENNTFVNTRLGMISFGEPQRAVAPARGALLEGNIFHGGPLLANVDPARLTNDGYDFQINRSLLPPEFLDLGVSNRTGDPLFVDAPGDLNLRNESPGKSSGPQGRDMGARVSRWITISGEPASPTASSEATLRVEGPGISHYRYRVNDGPYSDLKDILQPIALSGLSEGAHQVRAIGMNSAGVWQPEEEAAVSRIWKVDRTTGRLRINEVLASNESAVEWEGAFPDLVELALQGGPGMDLSGYGLTDDPATPYQFTFPSGTLLAPESFWVLVADGGVDSPGHLGFELSKTGDALYLFGPPPETELLDSVRFGLQVSGLSVARFNEEDWGAGVPTFGAANSPLPTGSPDLVRISEILVKPDASRSQRPFVELFNASSLPADLSGFAIGSDLVIPAQTRHLLPPSTFIAPMAHAAFYADGEPEQGADHLAVEFAEEQGFVAIWDSGGNFLDSIAYHSESTGRSRGYADPDGGELTAFPNPTPGIGVSDASDVLFSEIMAWNSSDPGSQGTFPDWVEVFNPTTQSLSLAGFAITDDPDRIDRWAFPSDAVLPPQGYLLIYFDGERPASGDNSGFGLKAEGEQLTLVNLETLESVDSVQFGLQAADWSLGRDFASPDWRWTVARPTPGAPNDPVETGSLAGVKINEWLADPLDGEDWFEIYNPSSLPVDLSLAYLSDDPEEPEKHRFPVLSFLGPGGFLQIHADDQSQNNPLHADFKLSAQGESILLHSPELQLVDRVDFGSQREGLAEGRYPDGASQILPFTHEGTPGARNQAEALVDADADGMPDEWEVGYGLDPNDASDALLDSDQDGQDNLTEYWAGTNPMNPESRFQIQAIQLEEDGLRLFFPVAQGRVYRIETSDRMDEPSQWRLALEFVADEDAESKAQRIPFFGASAHSFYRIVILKP